MAQKLFYQFDADEQTGFINACERHGYVYEDFDVVANDSFLNGSAGAHQREVSVARFDRIKLYLGESNTGWLHEFETDLAKGNFAQM